MDDSSCRIAIQINPLQKHLHSYKERRQSGRIHGFIPGASGYSHKPVCRSVYMCIAGDRIRDALSGKRVSPAMKERKHPFQNKKKNNLN